MKAIQLLWAVAILAMPAQADADRSRTYLASITGVSVGPDELVERFRIDTWAVDILAVCHIPPGWLLRAGRSATPAGLIEGEATHGVTRLNATQFSRLSDLALVRVDGPLRGGTRRTGPGSVLATFLGQVEISDSRGHSRQLQLRLENIRLTPAGGCPRV